MLQQNVLLKDFSNYKIGGPARYFFEFSNEKALASGLLEWQKIAETLEENHKKIFILGQGTNVLFDDNGFNGLVIHPQMHEINIIDDNNVNVGAAAKFSDLVSFAINNNLSGLEWAGGLPGSVGGAIFGNAGAFGGETKDNILEVKSFNLENFEFKTRTNEESQFEYRGSIFKKEFAQKEIILSAVFQMKKGEKSVIEQAVEEKIQYRKDRQPLEFPSAGSTFKNIPLDKINPGILEKFRDKIKNDPFPIIPAAVLLADANLFGLTVGDAQVSKKHPNFIINAGNARAADVKSLINKIKEIVKEKYSVNLESEVIIL